MKLLDLTCPTPAENLSADEMLLDAAEHGLDGEILRFWESSEYFVVVGCGNKIETEVNVAVCEARGIPILRRCSGGGAVVQGPGCLSYALVLSIADKPELHNVTAANRFIMERNRRAVETGVRSQKSEAGIEVRGHTDLTLDGLKFSGNAQRRRRQFILFHGTFLLNFDLALVNELLPLPSRQPDYRQSRGHVSFLKNLNLPSDLVKSALWGAWGGGF